MRKAASVALLLAAALGAMPAASQVLYKWVDEQGKTQYSDKPPKDFKGEVTHIETEVEKTTLPPSPPPPAASGSPAVGSATKPATAPAAEDIAAKRRATRARLEGRLVKAREKVEAARKALAQSEVPEPEEKQVVQQRTGGGMHGMAPRSNCRWEGAGNQKILMCPTAIPTNEYRERVAGLEEDLRKAEEELADAERAWRRGVD